MKKHWYFFFFYSPPRLGPHPRCPKFARPSLLSRKKASCEKKKKKRSLIRVESGAPAPQIFTLICGFEEDPSESVYSKWAPPAVSRFQRTRTVSHYYFIAAGHLWSRVAGNEKVQRIVSLVEPYTEKGLNYLICYRFQSWYFEDCVIIKWGRLSADKHFSCMLQSRIKASTVVLHLNFVIKISLSLCS